MPVLHAVSSSLFVKYTNQLDTLSPAIGITFVVYIKNAVKQCSVIKVTKAPLCTRGF